MPTALLRQILRRFGRHGSANALTVLALGISLGATVCAVLFAHRMFAGALPYPEPERLVVAELLLPEQGAAEVRRQIAYPALELLGREAAAVLSPAVMLDHARDLLLSHPAQPLLTVTYASPGYAELFAPPMALGRFPAGGPSDPATGGAVISHECWTERFGQRADVIGMSLSTAMGSFEVVGVTAADFVEPELHAPGHRTDLWLPWSANPSPRQWGWAARTDTLQLVGRLAPELDAASAAERLSTLFDRGWRDAVARPPTESSDRGPRVELIEARRAIAASSLALAPLLLVATVGLALMTVANLAHVIIARVGERRHEFAIQRALGAGSGRLFVATLLDAVALAVPSAVLAFVVVWLATFLMRAQLAQLLPRLQELTVGAPALVLCVAGALLIALMLAALAFVLVVHASSASPHVSVRSLGTNGLPPRLRTALLALQVGLSGVLIVANLALFREAIKVLHEPGIDLERSASLYLYQRPGATTSAVPLAQQFGEVRRRLADLPEVEQVSQSHSPLQDFVPAVFLADPSTAPLSVGVKRIDAAYLEVTGQALATGRSFGAEDIEQAAPVALVNAALARAMSREGDVLGSRLTREGGTPYTVIGVVDDLRYPGGAATDLHVYLPSAEAGSSFVLRFRPGEALSRQQLVAFMESLNPELGVFLYDDLGPQKAERLLPLRITAVATAVITLWVILSAALGLYGMLAHAAIQMQAEIGARLAFGARAGDVRSALANRHRQGLMLGAAMAVLGPLLLSKLLPAFGAPSPAWVGSDVGVALAVLGLLAGLVCHLSARPLLKRPPAEVLRGSGLLP